MFEDFTTPSYEEWIAQANQETRKIESISFPFHFNLDGLSLSAINTQDQLVNDLKAVYSKKTAQPGNSICQTSDIADTDWQRLGVEDVLLDLPHSKLEKAPAKLQNLKKLSSVGVIYHPDQLKQTTEFWTSENISAPPSITFYSTIFPDPSLIDEFSFPDREKLVEIILQAKNKTSVKYLGIRGDEFMNQGVTASQELAITLSLITHYWDKLTDLKIDKKQLLDHTEVALGLSGEFYVDLAKIRAIRALLYSLLAAFEIPYPDPTKIYIRAVSGLLNKTLYDPDENLLRITTEALAATLGGADVISLRTHDLHYQHKSGFGRRMAANVQNLMRYESHLQRVANPVDGSYFLEHATRQLIDAAWQTFLEIEKDGGIESYLNAKGEALFANSRDQKQQLLYQQRKKRVGVTRYINDEETISNAVVDSEYRPYSLTNQWEAIRLKVNQLQPENALQAIIIAPDKENNVIVSARITFVIDVLNSLGVTHQVVSEIGNQSNQYLLAGIVVFCADDNWYQQKLAYFLEDKVFGEAHLFAIGSRSDLAELARNKKIQGVLNLESDLSPLLDAVQQLIDHEA